MVALALFSSPAAPFAARESRPLPFSCLPRLMFSTAAEVPPYLNLLLAVYLRYHLSKYLNAARANASRIRQFRMYIAPGHVRNSPGMLPSTWQKSRSPEQPDPSTLGLGTGSRQHAATHLKYTHVDVSPKTVSLRWNSEVALRLL